MKWFLKMRNRLAYLQLIVSSSITIVKLVHNEESSQFLVEAESLALDFHVRKQLLVAHDFVPWEHIESASSFQLDSESIVLLFVDHGPLLGWVHDLWRIHFIGVLRGLPCIKRSEHFMAAFIRELAAAQLPTCRGIVDWWVVQVLRVDELLLLDEHFRGGCSFVHAHSRLLLQAAHLRLLDQVLQVLLGDGSPASLMAADRDARGSGNICRSHGKGPRSLHPAEDWGLLLWRLDTARTPRCVVFGQLVGTTRVHILAFLSAVEHILRVCDVALMGLVSDGSHGWLICTSDRCHQVRGGLVVFWIFVQVAHK